MKTAFKVLVFFTLCIFFLSVDGTNISLKKAGIQNHPTDSIEVNSLVNISRKDFEKKIDRKLGLFERMAFNKAKKKFRKEPGWVTDDRKIPAEAILSGGLVTLGLIAMFASRGSERSDGSAGVIGFIVLLAGGIFGAIALNKINKEKGKWKGGCLAIAGIVIVGVLLAFVLLAFAAI